MTKKKKKTATKKAQTTAKKSPAKTTAKKTPAKTTAKKTPAKTTAKKTPAKTTAKKTPAQTTAKKTAKKAPTKTTAKKAPASSKPLAMKLGILSGLWVIDNPPAGFELLLPPAVELDLALPKKLTDGDAVLAFVLDAEQVARLATRLKKCLPRVPGEARLWVAYPKLTSDIDTDLTRDRGWDTLTALGLRGVAIVSVDDTWAAVRFRPQA